MEKKKRIKSLFFIYISLISILISYYLLYTFLPILTLKCAFHEITGLNCPGCGITRMLSNFINFKFKEGIQYNYFLGITLPFIIAIIMYVSYLYINEKKERKTFKILCWIYLILLLCWGVLRNILKI